MAYFQMDDGFDSDSRVMRAGTAAFGLYSRCGVWVARNLTDGFVPSEVAALYGTREWIEKLVATGLWSPVEGGFAMPDYLDIHCNKTAVRVRELRAAAAARQQKLRDSKARKRTNPDTSRVTSRVTNGVSHGVNHSSLSDPPPKGGEEGGPALRAGAAPPSSTPTRTLTSGRVICADHHLELPCRGCASDLVAADVDDGLDRRPPSRDEVRAQLAANRGKHNGKPAQPKPSLPPYEDIASPDSESEVARNYARARKVIDVLDNRDDWLTAARKHLAELGEFPSASQTTITAARLYEASQRPDPPPDPEEG